jgi:chemotaxis family two-component system response regulator Rcp1
MNILLVEDNPADARLVREAVAENDIDATLHCAADGAQALAWLRAAQPLPDLVLLDLNLPGLGGKEVLREMKADPALKRIPVVVLTSSAAPQDVFDAYDAHVNSYMVKPNDFDAFLAMVGMIETYWLKAAQLPSRVA